MSDYADLIKRASALYDDFPVWGMKTMDELLNAIRDLETKCDNQNTTIEDLQEQLANAVPADFVRNCGCPSNRITMTVGECTDRGLCGCSIALSARYAQTDDQDKK